MENKNLIQKLNITLTDIFSKIADDKDVFAFGIFTDQDVTSILIAYNTYSNFSNQLKDWFLEDQIVVSHFRWSMAEWYEELGEENSKLNELNNEFYSLSNKLSEIRPDTYKDEILDMLHKVLMEMKKSGVFDSMKKNFIIYLEQADSYVDDKMKKRIQDLNTEKTFKEFVCDLEYKINR